MRPLVLLLALFFTCRAAAQTTDTTERRYTPAELRADVDSLYAQLRANHPALFRQCPRAQADAAFLKLRRGLDRPMTRMELFRRAMPFLALFRDGHTYLEVDFEGPELAAHEARGGRYFPARVLIVGDRVFCAASLEKGMGPGDELVRINGKRTGEVVRTLVASIPSDGEPLARATAERLFPYQLWAIFDWGADVSVDLRRTDGSTATLRLAGTDRAGMMSLLFQNGVRYQLQLHPEEQLAVVQINSYGQVGPAKRFIDSCFRVIRQGGYRNVALDLRRNGGGNSAVGSYFLAHLSRQPLRSIGGKTWRMGPLMNGLPQTHWLRQMAEEDRKAAGTDGEYIRVANITPSDPPALADTALYHPARFFLLTGPRTYSSAHMTALAVKCGALGTIIGEPTGERLDLTGEILEYKLPHTRLPVFIPNAVYVTPCGNGEQVGVQPDVTVRMTAADLRAERDPVLERLRQLAKQ